MKYLFLLTFLPLVAFAQEQTEIADVPNPYNLKQPFDQLNNSGIKKVILISKRKQNNFKDDTLYAYEYNTIGQKVISFRYDYNKLTNKTLMKYDKRNNQTEWTVPDENGTETTTKFYYNQFNKLDSTKQVAIRKDKIINTSRYNYTYKNEKLTYKQIIVNDVVNRNDFYTYKDSLLIEYKSVLSPNGYLISTYIYDSSNQLIQKETTHYFNTKTELWNKKNFKYQNGKLASEEELTYDNKKLLTYYSYDNNNRLKNITSLFGENSRAIEFDYDNFDFQKITINTNSSSPYLKFYIPLLLDNTLFPIKYTEVFSYDDKHNLISKRHFLGEELMQEETFKIEYFQ